MYNSILYQVFDAIKETIVIFIAFGKPQPLPRGAVLDRQYLRNAHALTLLSRVTDTTTLYSNHDNSAINIDRNKKIAHGNTS